MRWWAVGDPWIEQQLSRAEEVLSEARAFVAQRALLRDFHAPRRQGQVGLGSVLLAVGRGLRRSVSKLRAAGSADEIRNMEP
jgi:hypothetical protein